MDRQLNPNEIEKNYDQLAQWWCDGHRHSNYGLAHLARAIGFTTSKRRSLDVGCGSSGRFIQMQLDAGFNAEGLDISTEMIRLAREIHPNVVFHHTDITTWTPRKRYDLITAWDSTFHLPLASQEVVTKKLVDALAPAGVLLFTCGSPVGEIEDIMQGLPFGYSSLGTEKFYNLLTAHGCEVKQVDYDQYPETHVAIIAQRNAR